MKKTASFILCVLFLLALLSGCNQGGTGLGEIKIQTTSDTTGTRDVPESPAHTPDTEPPAPTPDTEPPAPPTDLTTDPPPPTVRPENAWAVAYLGVIDELTARHGEGAIYNEQAIGTYDEYFMTGLAVVRLIDFDGDGSYELLCAYPDGSFSHQYSNMVNKFVIYGYDNGLIVLMPERYVSNPGTDVSPSITFFSKFGKTFLVDVNEICYGSYYTLENGRMVSVLDYYYDFWADNPDQGAHTLNGEPVTEDELWYSVVELAHSGDEVIINFYYPDDNSEIIATRNTIAQLRALAQ